MLNSQIFSLRTKNRYRVGTALELQSTCIPLGVCTSGASIFKTFLNITWQKCCGSGSGIRDPVLFWTADPGSRMGKNPEPGSVIRDKHPGSSL